MFVGTYWSERRESRDESAARLVRFLVAIAGQSSSLSTWFTKARTKATARTPLACNVSSISSHLKVNRRDLGGDVMSELGFSLGIWNGGIASLSVTIGAYSPHIRNSVVLSFSERPSEFGVGTWCDLLSAMVREFAPDHGVVTSSEHLQRHGATNPWDAGWFTYQAGGSLERHSFD